MLKIPFKKKLFLMCLLILLVSGCSDDEFRYYQATWVSPPPTHSREITKIASITPYKSNQDYTVFKCATLKHCYLFLPSHLSIAKTDNQNPLFFFTSASYLKIEGVTVSSYDITTFESAEKALLLEDPDNRLWPLPIYSQQISEATVLPNHEFTFTGFPIEGSHNPFNSAILFRAYGRQNTKDAKTFLSNKSTGFYLLLQFHYLGFNETSGRQEDTLGSIPIYINNVYIP